MIYNFYVNKMNDYEKQIRIIFIIATIFLVLSLAILIPYVFNVHRTNNRVLSLFGMINTLEIKELAARCEVYSVNFIEDKKFLGESSQQVEEESVIRGGGGDAMTNQPTSLRSTAGKKKGATPLTMMRAVTWRSMEKAATYSTKKRRIDSPIKRKRRRAN